MSDTVTPSSPRSSNSIDISQPNAGNQKPTLHFWQIWNMCFGFMGIQFGFALQNANVSRIFQSLGASIDDIPILWIAAPLTGLIVQPIVGYFSDKTWTRLGRRRPYFLYGAIAASLALIAMPNSPTLWIAAGMLWIMDGAINVSMEPFRAFVGDMLPKKQRTQGFALQSFFIGTGAVIASMLPYLLDLLSTHVDAITISNTAEVGAIPDTVKYAFYIGAVVLFLCVGWTILRTREYSPEQLEAFDNNDSSTVKSVQSAHINHILFIKLIPPIFIFGVIFSGLIHTFGWAKELYILSMGAIAIAAILFIAYSLQKNNKTSHGFYQIVSDFFTMPKVMIRLAVVQFFSWFALFSMWIYSTESVTKHQFDSVLVGSQEYNDGANWVGVMFAAYNGFAALAALAIAPMANKIGRKTTYAICLCLGGLGLVSYSLISSPQYLIISMVGVGFAWAAILSLPYAILANHLPVKKMGIYMGIFNFFIVLPQILAASILGLFVRHIFSGEAVFALVMGGGSMFIAALALTLVNDTK